MKLPYREGDIFALPLGDGTFADAQIVACGRHCVDVAVKRGERLLPAVRVSDRALVLQRWRISGRAKATVAGSASNEIISPARFERMIATRLGVAELELAPLFIRRGTPHVSQNVHRLRLPGRGAIDVLGARIERIEDLTERPYVRALRISRVERFDLAILRNVRIDALFLESIPDLRGVETLLTRNDLRQLEMLDLWPLALEEVMPLVELRGLHRAEIDVGGRRKNVELNRRADWAYPWPLEVVAVSNGLRAPQ